MKKKEGCGYINAFETNLYSRIHSVCCYSISTQANAYVNWIHNHSWHVLSMDESILRDMQLRYYPPLQQLNHPVWITHYHLFPWSDCTKLDIFGFVVSHVISANELRWVCGTVEKHLLVCRWHPYTSQLHLQSSCSQIKTWMGRIQKLAITV